jgi:hypothetical protein
MAGKKFTQDLLGVKVIKEVTPGTFLAPTQDLCLERGAGSPKVEFEKFTCDPMSATSGGKHDIVSPGTGMIDYTVTQKMSDAKADYAVLLETCNFVGTAVTVPVPGVSYEMKTSVADTLSIEWIDPRATLKARGGKGAFSLKAEINQPVEIVFNYKFSYEGEVLLAAAAPDNAVPTAAVPNLLYVIEDCAGYSINGASGHFESFEIDWGTTVVKANTTCPSPSYVQEYAPTLKIVQSLTEENEASWEELKLNTTKNVVIGLFDSTGTKKGEIHIPQAVPNDMDKSGTDGRLTVTKSFACLPTVGDDNIQIVIFD